MNAVVNETVTNEADQEANSGAWKRASYLLSTDFCPWANRWVYWLKNPLWVLLLAIGGSALCGLFINPWIFLLTALIVITVGMGVILPWLSIRSINCDITFDVHRVKFGQPALVRLRIQNRWPIPVWGLSLIDGFQTNTKKSSTDGDEGIAFERVPALSEMEYSWPFVARQRGLFPVNQTAQVETSFPFGLLRARKTAAVSGNLLVWPETTDLDGLPDAEECDLVDELFSDRRVGEFGDSVGTRPFREGDSLRRVHWSQTARHQQLIVTERQAPITSVARIILDLSPEHHPIENRQQTTEQCVRVAASLCQSLHQQHCRIELQIGDDLLAGTTGHSGLNRLMDALAIVQVNDTSRRTTPPSGSRGFQVEITTPQGFRSGTKQVIVANDFIGPAWIVIHPDQPISELAPLYQGGLI